MRARSLKLRSSCTAAAASGPRSAVSSADQASSLRWRSRFELSARQGSSRFAAIIPEGSEESRSLTRVVVARGRSDLPPSVL